MIKWLPTYGLYALEAIYFTITALVCLRIIYDTRSITKTMAYLLLVLFLPILGMIVYFSFGINYRINKMYSKKLTEDENQLREISRRVRSYSHQVIDENLDVVPRALAQLILNDNISPLTQGNQVRILPNGETKFPAVLEAIRQAKHHIHIEYYIIEDDEFTRELEEILIQKVQEKVQVRVIYDDFGSSSIRRTWAKRLQANGVEIAPFYKIKFLLLANRLNYRNHRKIIVVDGQHGFVGGINLSMRYSNDYPNPYYWRDTHLEIKGPGVLYLQHLFICDWRFSAEEKLAIEPEFFPEFSRDKTEKGEHLVQIVASGPDSDLPTVLYSILQAIHLAKKELLITTPYFIPGESLMDALIVAALGGVKVKLLVPGRSDSFLVNAAAYSFYAELLHAGVEIYLYDKGFIHAKTMVVDRQVAIVGTANMDYRSFDLNFEVNALVYDTAIAEQLADQFAIDCEQARLVDPERWKNRSKVKQFVEKLMRLLAPML